MLSKTICIATDVGDTKIIIGKYGRVVSTEDYKAIANGVLEILRMPENDMVEMISKGYKHAVQNYSMNKCSNMYMSIYKG